jgi:hypothetical protein
MLLTTALIAGVTMGFYAQLVAPRPRLPLPKPSANAARVAINDNRVAAGSLSGRVLEISLDVVEGAWRPEGNDDPEVPVFAFAEAGKSPQNP